MSQDKTRPLPWPSSLAHRDHPALEENKVNKALRVLLEVVAILAPLAVMVAAVHVALRASTGPKDRPAPPARQDFQVSRGRSGRPVRQVRQGNGER